MLRTLRVHDKLTKITVLEIAMWDPLRLIVPLSRPLRGGGKDFAYFC